MHALSARLTGGKTLSCLFQRTWQPFSPLLFFAMAGAKGIARALNTWREEGLDLMGGADGVALDELITEFMADGGNETQPSSNCNSTGSFNS